MGCLFACGFISQNEQGGAWDMYKNKKIIKEPPLPQQPDKCKGCVWGEWRETKQLCFRVKCVKE